VELFAQLIANGLALGMLYLLIVLGMEIIMRATRILNFAHGQIYMLGAFAFFFIYTLAHLGFVLSLIAAGLSMGLLGALLYLGVFNTIQKRMASGMPFSYRLLMSAMASVGLMMALQQAAVLTFGSQERGIPNVFPELLSVGKVRLPFARLILVIVSLAICFGLYLLMYKTRTGKAMRAVSYDAEIASLQGISPTRLFCLSFAVGCALAGFAGGLVAPIFSVTLDMGTGIIFMAFLVMVLGGMGSYKGAVIGALATGLMLSFGYQFLGSLGQLAVFGIVIVALTFRPGGILGKIPD